MISEAAKQQHEEVAAPEQHDQPVNGGAHDQQLREMLTEAEVLALTNQFAPP